MGTSGEDVMMEIGTEQRQTWEASTAAVPPSAAEVSASGIGLSAISELQHSCVSTLAHAAERWRIYEALFETDGAPPSLGRYRVVGILGCGSMGIVLEAFDRSLGRQVALKVLHDEPGRPHTVRLVREALALAKLSHPNVVQVYEVGEEDGRTFVAMELVRGRTLQEWIRSPGPRRTWQECVEVFLQAGAGLAAAHDRGLVHRDFKPANLVIDDEGRVRVLDFGLAREIDPASADVALPPALEDAAQDSLDLTLTHTGTVLGTPAYMPPEQMRAGQVDARSDQFAFCASLYEALYGERPYAGVTMPALMLSMGRGSVQPVPRGTKVPDRLRGILLRGLAAEPERRWPSMRALLDELRRLVAPPRLRWLPMGLVLGLGMALGAGLMHVGSRVVVTRGGDVPSGWGVAERGTSELEPAAGGPRW